MDKDKTVVAGSAITPSVGTRQTTSSGWLGDDASPANRSAADSNSAPASIMLGVLLAANNGLAEPGERFGRASAQVCRTCRVFSN